MAQQVTAMLAGVVKSRADFERLEGATKQVVFAAAYAACDRVADETRVDVDDVVTWIVARRKRSEPRDPDDISDAVSKAAFMLAYTRPAFALDRAFHRIDDVKSIVANALLRTKLSANEELLRSQNKNVDDVKVEIVMSMVPNPVYYDRAILGDLLESLYHKYSSDGPAGIMITRPTSVLMAMWSVGSTPRLEFKEPRASYGKKVFGASFSFYFYQKEDQRMR